jgi:hypothetical protein
MLAIIAIVGSALYHLAGLTPTGITFLLLALTLIAMREAGVKQKSETNPNDQNGSNRATPSYWLLAASFFIAAGLLILYRSGTWEAIRSPWEVVPAYFFAIVFCAAALLVFAFLRGNAARGLILLPIFAALIVGVALAAFRAGYGFDPYIHQAAERYIQNHGFLTPRTFYYIGQYTIALFASAVTAVPIEWIDRLIVPTLAMTLPLLAFAALRRSGFTASGAAVGAVGIFALPFSSWIATTPQSLANLFLFGALLISLNDPRIVPAALFALAALATHALAGIPALIFVGIRSASRLESARIRRVLAIALFLAGAIGLPTLFLLAGGAKLMSASTALFQFTPYLRNRFDLVRDLAYVWGWNAPLILGFGAVAGWFALRARRATKIPFVSTGIATLASAGLTEAFLNFPKLPLYEQGDYAARLVSAAGLIFLPLFLVSLAVLAERATNMQKKAALAILLGGAITASLYVTYPRTDKYESTHGFNTSAADIHAVRAIEADAAGKPYIVLANQATSAAALREFGFRYYQTTDGELYFYSIPTGGPLYEKYLKMVYEAPTRATAEEAMDLADVNMVYLAVSRYWTQASRVVEAASPDGGRDPDCIRASFESGCRDREADAEFQIDNGRIYLFRYDRAAH